MEIPRYNHINDGRFLILFINVHNIKARSLYKIVGSDVEILNQVQNHSFATKFPVINRGDLSWNHGIFIFIFIIIINISIIFCYC